jgi:hypothetical protein
MPVQIQIFDQDGSSIEPGWPGAVYTSQNDIPVPNVGEDLRDIGGHAWRVQERCFSYEQVHQGETATLIVLRCSKAAD